MINVDEFRFNSGRIALDLPATVRRRASEPQDVLASSGAPARWLRDAGLSHELLALSPEQTSDLEKLREAIWAVADAAAAERDLPADAVATLNEMAALPLAVPKLDAKSVTVKLFADDPFQTALATIARDAIDLLGSPLRTRIKACEQPDCRMLFLDTSRSSRRRWCSMDRCGSRAKGAAFRARNRQDAHEH
ncbi:CGNR zinc finger domain-containing protein [Ochrobactrum sp. A-1]|uniref:CGNR zinc finger domain-containing protein n=1 Tax=Ochrobactrum sp. A-1 TaxID=2920940 RepID=UPI001F0AB4CF|nr:CGNR zinc finger domain-containing protein [Ochrobactrum sp. A-1]